MADQAPTDVKAFYESYHDRIADKRYNSPYWLRRYTHRQIHSQILDYLQPGQRVLDAGCGEGVLSCLAAQRGTAVTGVDISHPNIEGARALAARWEAQAEFIQADAEELPFADSSFDVVLSSHVLEHLPDLDKGLRELHRVTRSVALIAMPTCLNPSCWVLLGGDSFWKLSRQSLFALPWGFLRTIAAYARGDDGPNEGYGGNKDIPHVWRFPWVMRRQIESVGFRIRRFEAGPLIVPYLAHYLPPLRPVQRLADRGRRLSLVKYLGYGSLAVCIKDSASL